MLTQGSIDMREDQSLKLGVLGGGQLGRMLGAAGLPLAVEPLFWEPDAEACARTIGEHLCESYDSAAALDKFASQLDVCTFEFENVPGPVLRALAQRVTVYPPLAALEASQDRLVEKQLFASLGIGTAPYAAVDSLTELKAAVAHLGLPCILKTRRFGYDGKGQVLLREVADIESAWSVLEGVPLILEGFVNFTREVSLIAVRGRDGQTAFYPLSENEHRQGILFSSRARPDDHAQKQAEEKAQVLLDHLQYVGVLCLEMFDVEGVLCANEFAPRVHNSGHWTIEGAETSQFENHLRAVLGLPLGSTACVGWPALINLVGMLPPMTRLLSIENIHTHYYNKKPRPGRKVGHVTIRASNADAREMLINQVLAELPS